MYEEIPKTEAGFSYSFVVPSKRSGEGSCAFRYLENLTIKSLEFRPNQGLQRGHLFIRESLEFFLAPSF